MTPAAVDLILKVREAGAFLFVEDDTIFTWPGYRVGPRLRAGIAVHYDAVRAALLAVAYDGDPPSRYDASVQPRPPR